MRLFYTICRNEIKSSELEIELPADGPRDKAKWTFGDQKGEATVGADGLLAAGKPTISAESAAPAATKP